jgi:hypothetical protein
MEKNRMGRDQVSATITYVNHKDLPCHNRIASLSGYVIRFGELETRANGERWIYAPDSIVAPPALPLLIEYDVANPLSVVYVEVDGTGVRVSCSAAERILDLGVWYQRSEHTKLIDFLEMASRAKGRDGVNPPLWGLVTRLRVTERDETGATVVRLADLIAVSLTLQMEKP